MQSRTTEPAQEKLKEIGLSLGQKQMLLLNQTFGQSRAYTVPFATRISPKLDSEVLVQSIHNVLRQHITLHLTFPDRKKPMLKGGVSIPITTLNVQTDEELSKAETRFSNRTIDIKHGPMVYALVIQYNNQTTLLLNAHHISVDGWSWMLVFKEIIESYLVKKGVVKDSFNEKKQGATYLDFVRYQSDLLKSKKGMSLLRQIGQLDLPIEQLQLPRDRIKSDQIGEGKKYRFVIPSNLAQRMSLFAIESKVTESSILLSCYAILLKYYSNQESFVIGVPVANRMKREFQHVVGYLVNQLPVCFKFSYKYTFREIVKQVARQVLYMMKYQEFPLMAIIDALRESGRQTPMSLYQANFVYQSFTLPEEFKEYLEIEPVFLDRGGAVNDLSLEVYKTELTECFFEYDTSLFQETTIKRLSRRFLYILEQVLNNDNIPICHLNFQTTEERMFSSQNERRQLIFEDRVSVLDLIEEQCKKTPNAIALRDNQSEMTFNDLWEITDKIAGYLVQTEGALKNKVIGVVSNRTIEFVVSIISILKAGGAYLPISHDIPLERQRYMLENSKASLSILVGKKREIDWSGRNVTLVEILDIATSLPEAQLPKKDWDDLFYIIYTSGSTGKPKGVQITHRNIASFVDEMSFIFDVKPMNVAIVAPIIFDPFGQQLFPSLSWGHTIHIVPEDVRTDGTKLFNFLDRQSIHCTDGTPIHLKLLSLNRNKRLSECRVFIIGGDKLNGRDVLAFSEVVNMSEASIYNIYGLTECSIDSTVYPIDFKDLGTVDIVPIGKPLKNTLLRLINQDSMDVPQGVKGEILIGGEGVGLGYINQQQHTSKQFWIDKKTGVRWFKTGDIAVMNPNFDLEIIGRNDSQVKINGYRIEIGEIEAVLRQFAAIDAVVVFVDVVAGLECLKAAVYSKCETIVLDRLKPFLEERLPRYMIPITIQQIAQLPYTHNGKIDKEAVKNLVITENKSQEIEDVDLEEQLRKIWCDVLGVESVGLDDDFFDLGGNSLLTLVLSEKIERNLKINLHRSGYFNFSTINQLMESIRLNNEYQSTGSIIQLKKGDENRHVFFSPPLFGDVDVYKELIYGISPLVNAYLLIVENHKTSWSDLIKPLVDDIVNVASTNDDIVMFGWSFGGIISYDICKKLELIGYSRCSLLMVDVWPITNHVKSLINRMNEDILIQWFYLDLLIRYKSKYGDMGEESEYPKTIRDLKERLSSELSVELSEITLGAKMKKAKILLSLLNGFELNPINTDVIVLTASKNILVIQEERDQVRLSKTQWSQCVQGSFQERVISGNHYSMLSNGKEVIIKGIEELLRLRK